MEDNLNKRVRADNGYSDIGHERITGLRASSEAALKLTGGSLQTDPRSGGADETRIACPRCGGAGYDRALPAVGVYRDCEDCEGAGILAAPSRRCVDPGWVAAWAGTGSTDADAAGCEARFSRCPGGAGTAGEAPTGARPVGREVAEALRGPVRGREHPLESHRAAILRDLEQIIRVVNIDRMLVAGEPEPERIETLDVELLADGLRSWAKQLVRRARDLEAAQAEYCRVRGGVQ